MDSITLQGPSLIDIYKASAGSGKTFSLTLKYLELVLKSPEAYRRILAVTFTNKATAEMKHRIISVLKGLAVGDSSVDDYRRCLLEHFEGKKEVWLQESAKKVYSAILHDYSRFSISTIDAFVQRIIRSFAWELGIDGGFRLQLQTEPVKEDLADRMYKRLDEDVDLQKWVVEMAKEKLDEGKRWEFREDMLNLASEMFKEQFSAFEESMASRDDEAINGAFVQLNEVLISTLKGIENQWKEKAEQIIALVERQGLSKEDFYHGKGGFINYFYKASAGVPLPVEGRALAAMEEGSPMTGSKATDSVKESVAVLEDTLRSSLRAFQKAYEHDNVEYQTALAIRQNLGVLRLMRVFTNEMGAYRTENNALLISDTHNLLRKLTADTDASFIYEKTGSRYQHYLIDEFQDTSGFQWENFKPLLTESLSNGTYNLLVGDVKQAIYRWRNGDWRLLLKGVQQDLKVYHPREKTLQENYRSAIQVIQFNNLLFHIAPTLLQEALTASIVAADEATQARMQQKGYFNIFPDAYADSFQLAPPQATADGLVQIQFVDKESDEEDYDFTNEVLRQLHDQIQSLLSEGFEPGDLAVLTRTNPEARSVVAYLLEAQQEGEHRFKVVSGDALLLASSQAVQVIICALRWVFDQRNSLALAQVRQLFLLQKGADASSLEVFASKGDNDLLPAGFIQRVAHLRSLSLNELVHELVMIFELHSHEKNHGYLLAFADLVLQWSQYGEGGLQEFLHFWDDEGVKQSLPAGGSKDAIEVVTVHRSKGLAYTVVLMPFLNWNIQPKSGPMAPVLWAGTGNTRYNALPVVPVRFKSALATSHFSDIYYDELVMSAMDNLNVLYVAFTRARQRLYGWAPYKEQKKERTGFAFQHIGQLIRESALSHQALPAILEHDTRNSFDESLNCWRVGKQVAPAQHESGISPSMLPSLSYTEWQQRLTVRYQALREEEAGHIMLPRQMGVILHEIISLMKQPSDLESVIQKVLRDGLADDFQCQKMMQVLQGVLQLEALKPWSNKNFYRLAERNIINAAGDLQRPDLVLYNSSETIVYDFKFTSTDRDQERHVAQVQSYMQLLGVMGFASPKGFVIYGLDQKAIAV